MTKQKKVPLCLQVGHIWITTTSPNVRRCQRCPMAQHYHTGRWHTLYVPSKQVEGNTQAYQPPLF